MDLPGIYSLSPYTPEELVARNYLIDERPDAILNIIDGTNLERNLYLTTQLTELGIPEVMAHIEVDIKAAEEELDDDAESIITNERYVCIAEIIRHCYKKKDVGRFSPSDKIDRIVTNRWLGLPIFAVVMFLVYYISMVTVGAAATDWANTGLTTACSETAGTCSA